MTDPELRDEFRDKAKASGIDLFKHLEFHRFANGEFVELVAESAFVGYRMKLQEG